MCTKAKNERCSRSAVGINIDRTNIQYYLYPKLWLKAIPKTHKAGNYLKYLRKELIFGRQSQVNLCSEYISGQT